MQDLTVVSANAIACLSVDVTLAVSEYLLTCHFVFCCQVIYFLQINHKLEQ